MTLVSPLPNRVLRLKSFNDTYKTDIFSKVSTIFGLFHDNLLLEFFKARWCLPGYFVGFTKKGVNCFRLANVGRIRARFVAFVHASSQALNTEYKTYS